LEIHRTLQELRAAEYLESTFTTDARGADFFLALEEGGNLKLRRARIAEQKTAGTTVCE
jgi:hypothetical protein